MNKSRHRQWLKERAEVQQAEVPVALQLSFITAARDANDEAKPWWQKLFYTYRDNEEDDCDL